MRKVLETLFPNVRWWLTLTSDDLGKLIHLGLSCKEWFVGEELVEQTTDRPDVYGGGVGGRFPQELWRSIPKSDHLYSHVETLTVGVTDRTEISNLEDSLAVEQQIGAFQITMKEMHGVHVVDGGQQLVKDTLDLSEGELVRAEGGFFQLNLILEETQQVPLNVFHDDKEDRGGVRNLLDCHGDAVDDVGVVETDQIEDLSEHVIRKPSMGSVGRMEHLEGDNGRVGVFEVEDRPNGTEGPLVDELLLLELISSSTRSDGASLQTS